MADDIARHVVDSMRCGVVTVDRLGHVTTLNGLAATWLGVDGAGSQGRDCREVFAHCPALAHLLRVLLAAREPGARPRLRGQQLKDVSQLDGWQRDGSADYVASLCRF